MLRNEQAGGQPIVSDPHRCLECPMCRATISASTIATVCSSCPLYHLKDGCGIDLIACPECGYHSLPQEHGPLAATSPAPAPEAPQPDAAQSRGGSAATAAPRVAPEVAACAGATRLSEVRAGTRVRLLGFNGIDDNHLGRLTAYGLLPGVTLEVLQRFPAIILAIYQAELALETKLAESVWVLPEN